MASAWQTVRLGEVADFRNGLNFTKGQRGAGLCVVGIPDFQDRTVAALSSLDEVDERVLRDESGLLHAGDIIFVRSNGNRDLIGRSLYIASEPVKRTSHSGFTIRLRFKNAGCHPRFYAYFFRGQNVRALLSSHGGGTNINNLNQGILTSLTVPLPPLPVQRRIASILSAYDDLIENNTRRIALLEEMARRVFEEWFVQLHFPGHHKTPITRTNDGPLPEGWESRAISDAFDIMGGGTPSKTVEDYWVDGSINWYTPSDLTGNETIFMDRSGSQITERGLKESSARLFPPFSVMMTSRATLGVVAINTTTAATNQGFITCIPNDRLPLYFLFYWIRQNAGVFEAHASGATFKEITKGTFKALKIVLPPRDLVHAFNDALTPAMELILALQRQTEVLRSSRDLLLPKLISGEIDVSNIKAPAEAA